MSWLGGEKKKITKNLRLFFFSLETKLESLVPLYGCLFGAGSQAGLEGQQCSAAPPWYSCGVEQTWAGRRGVSSHAKLSLGPGRDV